LKEGKQVDQEVEQEQDSCAPKAHGCHDLKEHIGIDRRWGWTSRALFLLRCQNPGFDLFKRLG
jgi:hypothetical protein